MQEFQRMLDARLQAVLESSNDEPRAVQWRVVVHSDAVFGDTVYWFKVESIAESIAARLETQTGRRVSVTPCDAHRLPLQDQDEIS